ncbi:MAG: hypothetical protein P8J89_04240 [Phycisphaerales bacterium]|nr:hypothetical protein [Phycisphaerales bacterium]
MSDTHGHENMLESDEILCVCGYSRHRLQPKTPCPECGHFKLQKSELKVRAAWRSCPSRAMKIGFVLSASSLALGLLNAAAMIYAVAWLMTPGFKGGTAGFILIYPPLIWVVVQLPAGLLANFFRFSKDCSQASMKLKKLGGDMIAIGLIAPFILIGLIFAFMIIRAIGSD